MAALTFSIISQDTWFCVGPLAAIVICFNIDLISSRGRGVKDSKIFPPYLREFETVYSRGSPKSSIFAQISVSRL